MKKFRKFLSFGLALSALFLASCSSDDDDTQPTPDEAAFQHGIFILNEGNFGAGNASVDFLSNEGVVTHDIFSLINNEPLGDVAQSIYMDGDYAFIVLNGSAKVEVVNRYSFEKLGTVSTGLVNPRYMTILNGKGYVTNWGDPTDPSDDFVAVINLSNFTVSSTIPVAEGPEQIVSVNNLLYVAHMGGWNFGNTISVINPGTNSVSSSIQTGDVPKSLIASNDFLYVLCSGKPAWSGDETVGSMILFDTNTNLQISTVQFPLGVHPTKLVTDGNMLYYTEADIVKAVDMLDISNSTTLFSTSSQGVFGAYGMAVSNGKVYIGDAGDYTSDGKVLIYTTTGNLIGTHTAGLLPNNFGFND